jgi:hypothetical protein
LITFDSTLETHLTFFIQMYSSLDEEIQDAVLVRQQEELEELLLEEEQERRISCSFIQMIVLDCK